MPLPCTASPKRRGILMRWPNLVRHILSHEPFLLKQAIVRLAPVREFRSSFDFWTDLSTELPLGRAD